MRIVHLSKADAVAGAARAACRIHEGLRAAGHDSRMIVSRREGDDPHVAAFRGPRSRWGRALCRLRRWRVARELRAACADRAWRDVHFTDDRGEPGRLLLRQAMPCDVITIHWAPGLLDHCSFFGS